MFRLAPTGRAALRTLCVLLCLGHAGAIWAQDWMISVLEGDAVVIDGLRRVTAAAGLKLGAGAIVETSAKTVLLRLEAADQTTYDLGGDTRVMVSPPGFAARSERYPQLYLLQGWVKATQRGAQEAPGVVANALELLPFKGSVLLQTVKREHFAFVESGRADLIERRMGSGSVNVGTGEFLAGEGSRRGSISARPAPGWLQGVPRAFRDPIPLRAAALRERRVEPVPLPGPTYAHLADWLIAEPTLRREMPTRFAALLRDADFHNQVTQHLNQHPEWAPLLTAEAAENARMRRRK